MFTLTCCVIFQNHEHFVQRRLESIQKQTRAIDQLIVIDNASHDKTWNFAEDCVHKLSSNLLNRVILHANNEKKAIDHNWQIASKLCTSEFLWIAEGDDYCDKDFLLEFTNRVASSNSIPELFITDSSLVNANGRVLTTSFSDWYTRQSWDFIFENSYPNLQLQRLLQILNPFPNISAAIWNLTVFNRALKRTKSLDIKYFWDWAFYFDAIVASRAQFAFLNKPLNKFVRHNTAASISIPQNIRMVEHRNLYEFFEKVVPADVDIVDLQQRMLRHLIK